MDRWEVKLYERKRNPDPNSRPRKVGRRILPEDMIPKQISGFPVMAANVDDARRRAREHAKKRLAREVCSINVSAEAKRTLIVHVFEKGKQS